MGVEWKSSTVHGEFALTPYHSFVEPTDTSRRRREIRTGTTYPSSTTPLDIRHDHGVPPYDAKTNTNGGMERSLEIQDEEKQRKKHTKVK